MFEFEGSQVCRVPALDLIESSIRIELEAQLYEAACRGFGRNKTAEFELDVHDHLRQGKLYVVMKQGRAEGFAVMQDFPLIEATYIAGIVKNRAAPRGVIEEIVKRHANDYKIVTVRTQNDRVVEIMRDICELVVPLHRESDEREKVILQEMGLLGINVGEDLVAKGHYGGKPMIDGIDRRRSSDVTVREITERINYYSGDALLLVGYRQL